MFQRALSLVSLHDQQDFSYYSYSVKRKPIRRSISIRAASTSFVLSSRLSHHQVLSKKVPTKNLHRTRQPTKFPAKKPSQGARADSFPPRNLHRTREPTVSRQETFIGRTSRQSFPPIASASRQSFPPRRPSQKANLENIYWFSKAFAEGN